MMKRTAVALLAGLLLWLGMSATTAHANGWATAGKILAGVAGADLLFNGSNSMVGRTVTGIGSIFTGGCSRPVAYSSTCVRPTPAYYSPPPPPRRCWDEVRREPGYDRYGNFIGYFDKRVTVCSGY
jgi:hypothetical protein